MKKSISIFILAAGMLLTACSQEVKEKPKKNKKTEETVVQKQDAKSKEYAKMLEKVESITFGDVVEDSFEERVEFELDKEDIASLKEIQDDLILEEGGVYTYSYYKLTLYDGEKKKLDEWIIGWDCEAETTENGRISRKGKFGEWVEAFQDKYKFRERELYARTPGKNYLKRFQNMNRVELDERTENNFIEGIEYELNQQEIEQFKSAIDTAVVGKEKKRTKEYYYQIYMCIDGKEEVGIWTVDFNGRIYTGEDYEISGEALEKWKKEIEEKSGLAERKKERITQEQDKKSKEYARILENVESITFGDVIEDFYVENIAFELDKEDIASLKEIQNDLILEAGSIYTKACYKLTLYDSEKNKLDEWTIGLDNELKTKNDKMISRKGKFGEWIEAFEEQYKIDDMNLFARTPGKDYLKRLKEINRAVLDEKAEKNYMAGITYRISESDIEELKAIENEIIVGKEKHEIEEYYKIETYAKGGAEVYTWTVDFDGKMYTEGGYELFGEALMKWKERIEEKSGLSEKEEKEGQQKDERTERIIYVI